jgi:hypothetical protein
MDVKSGILGATHFARTWISLKILCDISRKEVWERLIVGCQVFELPMYAVSFYIELPHNYSYQVLYRIFKRLPKRKIGSSRYI